MNVTLTRPSAVTLAALRPARSPNEDRDPSAPDAAALRLDTPGSSWLLLHDAMARARFEADGAFAGLDDEQEVDRPGAERAAFERRFGELASDPAAFHALLGEVYGENYDVDAAEALRTRALGGDFGWLPQVRYVGPEVLGGANGAYDAASDTVYIDERLRGTARAGEVFVEEAGHALDVVLNGGVDTAGDEGELLRRMLAGEALSAGEIAAIRAEDDGGTIVVDGERREVEFWGPWDTIKEYVIKPIAETRAGRAVISSTMERLHAFGMWLDGATLAPDERRLTSEEIDYLRPIYGDSIDYDAIRIQRGGVKDMLNMRANTVGHDIFMDDGHSDANMRDENGDLTEEGREWLETLGHEAMHVWQYEQQGPSYIGDALVAQWFGDGYNLRKAFADGVSFDDMNPEQQGVLAQYIGLATFDDPAGALTEVGFEDVSGIALTSDQWRVVQDAHATLLAG